MAIGAHTNQSGIRPTLSVRVGQSAMLASDGTNSKRTRQRRPSSSRCRTQVRTSAPGKRLATGQVHPRRQVPLQARGLSALASTQRRDRGAGGSVATRASARRGVPKQILECGKSRGRLFELQKPSRSNRRAGESTLASTPPCATAAPRPLTGARHVTCVTASRPTRLPPLTRALG